MTVLLWRQANSRRIARIAVLGALALGLGLAGCGRRGPLDAPPTAAINEPSPATAPSGGDQAPGAQTSGGAQTGAAQGAKKRLPIDAILD